MTTLQNDQLIAQITDAGIELASLQDRHTEQEYIWQADPKVWGSHAPILFPIIGALKDGQYTHDGQTYSMPKHGIVRGNDKLKVVAQNINSVTYQLETSPETQEMYPFDFVFRVTYRLDGRSLVQEHVVINRGNKNMYFSLGGHPAFRVPVKKGEKYEDYYLLFEEAENAESYVVNADGLIGADTVPVPWKKDRLPLSHELFAKDALVFKNIKSRRVGLVHKRKGEMLSVSFPNFSNLGIWAKPNGDFVCIEPWSGIADAWNATGELKEKEGIMELKRGEAYKSTFDIKIA